MEQKAKQLSMSYSRYKIQLDLGREWLVGRLSGGCDQWKIIDHLLRMCYSACIVKFNIPRREIMPISEDILRRLRENDLTLTEVDLAHVNLTNADIRELVTALEGNSHLQTFNLDKNNLGALGAGGVTGLAQRVS